MPPPIVFVVSRQKFRRSHKIAAIIMPYTSRKSSGVAAKISLTAKKMFYSVLVT